MTDLLERLRPICRAVGFDLDRADDALLERLRLLAERSETVGDAERMAAYANAVIRFFDEQRPSEAFSESERRTITLGCLLSDVGKTGPRNASPDEQRLIVEMFAVEGVPDDTMPVSRFLETYFDDAAERVARFRGLGLDPAMTMREFWNLHSGWTLAILESARAPADAVAACATHHLLDGVNPEGVVSEGGRFSRDFGGNVRFDRAEKVVILLDKYDAVRRRGRRSHAGAIEWLRERIANNPRVRSDAEIQSLISVIDEVLGGEEPHA
jgi:hypothetical protein